MKINNLINKRILIWGYGLEGKSAADLLIKKGIKNKILVATANKIDVDATNIEFILEDDILNHINEIDVVIKSSGVSSYKKEIEILRNNNIVVTTILNILLAEVAEYKNTKTIGITGTKGKSTTASICNHILQNLNYKSILLGNIGISFLDVIDYIDNYDYLVLELSSYQVKELNFNLDYSIILNLFPEHIDWHINHENYFKDKLNIVKYAKNPIINTNDNTINKYLTEKKENYLYFNTKNGFYVKDNYIFDSNKKIFDINSIENIKGNHIFGNICAILEFLKQEKIDITKALNTLKAFKTLEHRLEVFYNNKETNTIFVDDSISTIPEATIEALKTFKNNEIFLVLGGFDREQDYSYLVNFTNDESNVKKIFLLGPTGKRLEELFKNNNKKNIEVKYFENLEDLVKSIKSHNLHNKTVLLSPASPSYGMFKNFEERGNKFKELIKIG